MQTLRSSRAQQQPAHTASSTAQTPVGPNTDQPVTPSKWRGRLSTAALFVGALLLAIGINAFVMQSYEVDGSSMEPTLQHANRLIIWKLPRTFARITGNEYVPARHDIVVFKKPGFEKKEQLIKRVIGLPGERVTITNGVLRVYNKQFPDGFDPDADTDYGAHLLRMEDNVEAEVKPGEVFVLGDNRLPGGSLDSRSSLGNIPVDHIVGKLKLRLFPLNKIDTY
jgi:signal peptidase I